MLYILLFTPLILGFVSYFLIFRRTIIGFLAVVGSVLEIWVATSLAFRVIASGGYPTDLLRIDALSSLILLLVSSLGLFCVLYSIGYLKAEERKGIIGFRRIKQYFTLIHLFLFALFLAVTTPHPVVMWIAIEATTLSTAFLMSFYHKPTATEAAWKYLVMNSIGLLLGFFGTLVFSAAAAKFADGSDVSWDILLSTASRLDPQVVKIAFIFVLIGFGTKMGLFPMHSWKPDAYSKAPTSAVGLMAGAFLSVAFYAILRFKMVADTALGADFSAHILLFLGTMSIVFAAFALFVQKNYKRLLAYSGIENAGFLMLGAATGFIGLFGAFWHIVFYSLTKALLFFAAGNIFLRYSSTKSSAVKQAFQKIPLTSGLFLAGFLLLSGVLPFGLFMSKWYILSQLVASSPWLAVLIVACLGLIFIGFLRHAMAMLFGSGKWSQMIIPEDTSPAVVSFVAPAFESPPSSAGEANRMTVVIPVVLLLCIIVLGLFPPSFIVTLLQQAAAIITIL